MAFVSSFTPTPVSASHTFVATSIDASSKPTRPRARSNAPRAVLYAESTVDEFMARSVHAQYVAKACPSGVPPIQCIEGATSDQPYALRTLKRQSQLRYLQLPVATRLGNMYAMRQAALSAAHGCSHEESRVAAYPRLASAYVLGQAEASKACVRYFTPSSPAEEHMAQAVENRYMAAINPRGTFSVACTDGQARYEAYLAQVRGLATRFRSQQYSTNEKESMKFASRAQALAMKGHNCTSEETVFCNYPIVASAMRPIMGYYPPFVESPKTLFGFSAENVQESALGLGISGPTAVAPKGYADVVAAAGSAV